MKKTIILPVLCCVAFLMGCGAKTELKFGVIAIAEQDRALIDLGNIDKIKNGDRVLVYREAALTHPVNGETLGTVKDEIGKFKVEDVQITAMSSNHATIRFDAGSSIEKGDKAVLADEVEKAEPRRVQPIGKVTYFDPESKVVEVGLFSTVDVKVGELLTVGRSFGFAQDMLHNSENLSASSTFVEMRKLSELEVKETAKSKVVLCRSLASRRSEFPEIDDPVVKLIDDKIIFWYSGLESYSKDQSYKRYYRKAIRMYSAGEYWEAVELLKRVEKTGGKINQADVQYLLGSSYKHLGVYDKAESFLKKSIELNPHDPNPMVELAYMYLSQNRSKEAAKILLRLAELMPDNPAVTEDLDHYNKW